MGTIRRLVAVREPAARMEDAELASIFSTAEGDPIFHAVRQVLGDYIASAQAQVSAPEMADHPGRLAHTAGGLEWLSYLAADLAERAAGR